MIDFSSFEIITTELTFGETNKQYEASLEISGEYFFCIGKTKEEAISGLKRSIIKRIICKN